MFGCFPRGIPDICHAPIVERMSAAEPAPIPPPGAIHLARGISATWWYTASAVVAFELLLVFVWLASLLAAGAAVAVLMTIAAGGLLWCASTILLLFDYRRRGDASPGMRWSRLIAPFLVAVAFGVVSGLLSGSWLLAVTPVAQFLVLQDWPRGVRLRVVALLTATLIGLWIIDSRFAFAQGDASEQSLWSLPAIYSVILPVMTVSSLWWWDVLITLDRARASEARLAATQERLRVATDVHDLQGHHLQVIALQLELAERLLSRDPAAALQNLQAARASVDDARQGTRDLATRFRSVPLSDELANAQDLLEAAGLRVVSSIAADADGAPASALGPVIRETTTNVLRHGGGRRASLSLTRESDSWRYEISNDVVASAVPESAGSGLEGVGRRISEARGTLDVQRGPEDFTVTVTVPSREGYEG